jgi:hypothetical protein
VQQVALVLEFPYIFREDVLGSEAYIDIGRSHFFAPLAHLARALAL